MAFGFDEVVDTSQLSAQETTETPAVDVNKLVEVYIKIRDKIGTIQTAADNETAELRKQMQTIEDELRKLLSSTGSSSFSCKIGTVFVTEQTTAKVADWKALIAYVEEHKAYHLLNHAVNKTAVKEHLDSLSSLPPGVDFSRRLNIQVRRKS